MASPKRCITRVLRPMASARELGGTQVTSAALMGPLLRKMSTWAAKTSAKRAALAPERHLLGRRILLRRNGLRIGLRLCGHARRRLIARRAVGRALRRLDLIRLLEIVLGIAGPGLRDTRRVDRHRRRPGLRRALRLVLRLRRIRLRILLLRVLLLRVLLILLLRILLLRIGLVRRRVHARRVGCVRERLARHE